MQETSKTNDFVFTQELLDFPVAADVTRPSHPQIAFAEDGQTGYISLLGANETVDIIGGAPSYYPIIMKTTDGGATWSSPQRDYRWADLTVLPGIINDLTHR